MTSEVENYRALAIGEVASRRVRDIQDYKKNFLGGNNSTRTRIKAQYRIQVLEFDLEKIKEDDLSGLSYELGIGYHNVRITGTFKGLEVVATSWISRNPFAFKPIVDAERGDVRHSASLGGKNLPLNEAREFMETYLPLLIERDSVMIQQLKKTER